jgi:hypothetical protein
LISNEEKEKSIEDYVERETAVPRKRVQDAATAMMQQLKDMTAVDSVGGTTRKTNTMIEEILIAIGDS